MNRRVVLFAVFTVVAMSAASYAATQMVRRGVADAATPMQLNIQVQLDPGEKLSKAAAGELNAGPEPALVLGTLLPDGRSRVRVLHWQGGHYETVSAFTNGDVIDSLIIQNVTNSLRPDLITLWRSGSGGYLDVHIFEWNGQTYREIWNLFQFEKAGQLTQGATLSIRHIDQHGNVELVIRAPNVKPGENILLPLPHQVSIYRWDVHKQTLVLYRRFVDPSRTFE